MKKLLVGNGPNRLANERYSWPRLMTDLRHRIGVETPIAETAPFSLEYEAILQAAVAQNRQESDLADSVGEFAKRIAPTSLHTQLMALGFAEVLTTNYDWALELAAGGDPSSLRNEGTVRERRYSLFRHFNVDEVRIWHIHGDCSSPQSITLGLDHYAGHLQRIRNYLLDGLEYENASLTPLARRIKSGAFSIETWVDLWFSPGDLHIVGFSFDFTEVHLWWLLAYRARLMRVRGVHVPNDIIFHTLRSTEPEAVSRKAALKSQLVSVVEHGVENGDASDYSDHYSKVVKWLKTKT